MSSTEREIHVAHAVFDLALRPAGFDPLELLHDLTAHAVALLPVQCAGVTVLNLGSDDVVYATASDERCLALEEDQRELDEGPCLDATRGQRPLPVTALTGPPGTVRWPRFAARAQEAGITSVAAVLLRLPGVPLGALNLMMSGPPHLSDQDLQLAQTLADATSAALSFRQQPVDRVQVLTRVRTALDSRMVIEQAKGVLYERLGISMDEALRRLRAHARSRRQKLTELSTQVVHGHVPADLFAPGQ